MGLKYNLTELFNKAKDPSSGVTNYEGIATLPWSNGQSYHHFTTKSLDGQGKTIKQNVYYDLSTLNMRYMMIEGSAPILVTDTGFVEKTFTDQDFEGLDTCTSNLQLAHAPSFDVSALKGLRL